MASTASSPDFLEIETSYDGVNLVENLKLLENPESITVTVGPQGAAITWHLPKALLTRHSPFFAAALNGSFVEAKSNSVTLPDDDPEVFRFWVQWLYVGKSTRSIARREDLSNILVKGWILGDHLGCHTFQDTLMVELLGCHSPNRRKDFVGPSTLRAAYEGSVPGSKLRDWAIDFFLFETEKKECEKASVMQRNRLWFEGAKDIEDFAQDYMEARLNCTLEGEPGNPYFWSDRYMVR